MLSDRAAFLISAALVAPKTHAVITTYDDGMTKRHETRSQATAEAFAAMERAKLDRALIDRASGATVRALSVTVVTLEA